MKSSSEHLLKLVSDLLDFHRLDLNKAEVNRIVFNPAQMFEEIRVSFELLTAAKGLALKCNIAPELSDKYISDPLRMRQIVNNLLSNAVKFTQKGGITLDVSYRSSRLTIAITDTGKGMAPGDRERIFQEFTRLPGAQGEEGFGLGLSIVKKLVTLLEGEIDVKSTLGEGSCFTVILPLYPVGRSVKENKYSEAFEEKSANLETVNPQKALRILLIDDDKIQLGLTAAMLAQSQIVTVCCEQLEELIEQLRSSEFDVLLTDIQMPAINGFDLVKLLRASNISQARTIPIIAVTARSEMDEEALHEHGFAGCLHKPFTIKELLSMVHGGQVALDKEKLLTDEVKADSPQTPSCNSFETFSLDFPALTAFSGDDPEAAQNIMKSFIDETIKNAARMQHSLDNKQVDGIAAMAHKLLPLFTLIGAVEIVPKLSWLEGCRSEEFTQEIQITTKEVLGLIQTVIHSAQNYRKRDSS